MKKNITQLTLRSLLPLLLGFMVITIIVIGFNFRSLILLSMQEHIVSIANIVKAGLTAHMKEGIMEKRGYFLQEIANGSHIKSIYIIRSDEVRKQFGNGLTVERGADRTLLNIMSLKKPHFTISEWGKKATIRAVIPYIATSKGHLNCLQCHHVAENTVLGAVDMEMDVTEYRNWALLYLLIISGIISVFTIAMLLSTSHIIEKFVRNPLLELITFAKSVFYRTDVRNPDMFETKEFAAVAYEFLKFGEELNERESRIEQTLMKFNSLNSEIDATMKETLFAMGEAEEKRSSETRNHTRRVVEYSRLLGELIGLEEKNIELLATAAPLHDIGKIGIPDSILLKPGRLSEEEHAIMQMHTTIGHDILRHSEHHALQAAATIAYQHHERWDGFGYPNGLKGEEIHIFGRIVAVADVFDALRTKRVYKERWPIEKVMAYFDAESGKSFDPQLVRFLIRNHERFEAIYALHDNEEIVSK
ncbi:MAG: HD domain-containing protein [Sulfuricurvum sp.]|jgi:response regulator RpfG family c-di-GMP phosphodiesterase|uniref:HD-GYP domain-containing protein n=1 Tax=Sulfuricurvum sp. TaxID=2025608 RepID=UPI0025E9C069|nr:HD domain-containing phosphohydrolase [Sulfuricurvum sp.]MCK9372916.1 HD domain-containing protein [Sulfuricurvum sp.]